MGFPIDSIVQVFYYYPKMLWLNISFVNILLFLIIKEG